MNEKLIHDYRLSTGNSIYEDFEIHIQAVTGGIVIFREQEPHQYGEFEQITVDILDILAWVYSRENT